MENDFDIHDRDLLAKARTMLAARRGYTQSHQVIANVKDFGGGLEAAGKLAEANIITNKNLIPGDKPEDWDRPSGLRIGTIEVTRLGLVEKDMPAIAGFFERILVKQEQPDDVRRDVEDFRRPLQTFYYCFDNGWPPGCQSKRN
jgi:glycine hydroxymethyltransferase